MKNKLHIALIADPELPVPPQLYGGIERIIDMLIKGLMGCGHTVSLFAHQDSVTAARLYPYKGKTSQGKIDFVKNAWLINKTICSQKIDIIHCFGRLAYLLPQMPLSTVKIMSYQRNPTVKPIQKAVKFSRKNTLYFTGCSEDISRRIRPYATAFTVYNGVPLTTYTATKTVETDAPLLFLGRIEPIKGTHTAIRVAKATGRKLIIAGNIPEGQGDYFHSEIAPYLDERITYIGAVNDAQKNNILGKAAALLMPIEWDEPFGIVMAEAMACGTPVIGFNRGAVPEIVQHEHNGFLCSTAAEMVAAIQRLPLIDRELVRKDAEERFSSAVIVDAYLKLYAQLINS